MLQLAKASTVPVIRSRILQSGAAAVERLIPFISPDTTLSGALPYTRSMTPKQKQQRESKVVWFEIPAADMDRACRFYETVLATTLKRGQFGAETLGVFPYEAPAVSGCISLIEGHQPSANNTVVYLNADPDLDSALARVDLAGGKVVVPRTALPPGMGFFARIQDTEGNLVGLHAIS
jgi:predicted enzyme related to lactoylglutathione lyase